MSSILIKNRSISYRKDKLNRADVKTSHAHEFLLQSGGAGFIKNACFADSGAKACKAKTRALAWPGPA
jgi:hypothetical protein